MIEIINKIKKWVYESGKILLSLSVFGLMAYIISNGWLGAAEHYKNVPYSEWTYQGIILPLLVILIGVLLALLYGPRPKP